MAKSVLPVINKSELQIIRNLGKGAFGSVELAKWNDIKVAVKYFHGEDRDNFEKEEKAYQNLSHENIVRIYGVCKDEPGIIMEYAVWGSLYDLIHKTSGYRFNAESLCYQIAKGLEYVHGLKPKPIIHRDIKPQNLLIFRAGEEIKICDFGHARELNSTMSKETGTLLYMAPEVMTEKHYDEKVDVFSWGIVVWEMFARQKPYYEHGLSNIVIAQKIMYNGLRPNNSDIKPPVYLNNLMTRAWDVDPEARPSMSNIVDEIFGEFQKKIT